MSADAPGILFTAFEPSGDDHAAPVIAEIKARWPEVAVYAWGGPKMAAAGAVVIEETGRDAVMGVPGLGKIIEHLRINRRIRRWLATEGKRANVVLHVPVDSPGANFPICKITRRAGLKVVHLVAPQVWAWASWRIRKLRRLTNLVLCLLPFEEAWFLDRGVPAKFIGHPLFDHALDEAELDERVRAHGLDARQGSPRIALMPGSRPSEMTACFPILLDALARLKQDFPQTSAVVAATRPEAAELLRRIAGDHGAGEWPADLGVVSGDTDAVVRWCDFALVVSGTVTLQIARQYKPMAAVYRPKKWVYHLLGRWLVSTEVFTLPNLIAGGTEGRGARVIPEFIPHWGDGEELAVEVIKFMRRTGYADDQREGLRAVCRRFEGLTAGREAAEAIGRVLGLVGTGEGTGGVGGVVGGAGAGARSAAPAARDDGAARVEAGVG